ncbi:type II toxin-antitoxin system HipA family toxin [Rhizobium ruizarguesonis]|uniref:Type II toxin-antitoxin system HipA family toxin n=1 Tax=Rhizobium ruizarguesonis TaxID=2081791 RepID=A0ABY1WZJ3_9HYPH|nr:type II toxin-antitoxin system HipA family toxin [Rhizobium ruizarguesonis]QIJ44367.1 type II toxin-antitoxin system HipA family toxin [Rhizobium leguminosarum]TAU76447.1 type II toxin-antitoxin system HipA family toxin [Rhizobium ruizarguesonis]TAV24025.1 type II toxin-antitoxin system HipA family toxin [Rhizobium ruizarguesonis]TAV25070.1 type II toxin-antitoxin system HipA family toxin [Rhizobium ruizarguesonis]TAW06830.1 type II toxin-antitoxin system HipA family toxin [Rhizobium ruizar
MPLHLVGENIDKTRAFRQAEAGKLVHLMRGIYVDADEDVDQTVRIHAVRIAKYLYPNAYLSAASAVLLGPMRDGRLFLTGRRVQRQRIRTLEIIQNKAPDHPSVAQAVVGDDLGELRVHVSSLRQRFLEAFRIRSEHAASFDETMKEGISSRLIDEYGGAEAAADAVFKLARDNDWLDEGRAADRFLKQKPAARIAVTNQAALDLIVAWHGAPIGNLMHDGFEWRWRAANPDGPPLVRQSTPGRLPPFIESLLPEGWLNRVLNSPDERVELRTGKRYMSNITIVERAAELADLPADILLTRLNSFATDHIFTGAYAGPGRGDIQDSFEQNLARMFATGATPRLSGVQIKAPMFLDADGTLMPATGKPFTHILKPAGTSGFEALPAIEWQSMELARAAGFTVPEIALVAMPDGMPAALVVERFDIRTSLDDRRCLALEDMTSVLGVRAEDKYTGTMERIAGALRTLSTDADADLLLLLRRALFAWLIADGDMHLKNMAVLKIAEPRRRDFSSVRLAPLYDAVTTRVFPNLQHDRMALKITGKDERLKRADFKRFASTAGIPAVAADAAMDQLVAALRRGLEQLAPPPRLTDGSVGAERAAVMREIVGERLRTFD